MKKKKVGKPRQGKQTKKVCSIRLEPRLKNKIIKKFGSLQKAIDYFIKNLFSVVIIF